MGENNNVQVIRVASIEPYVKEMEQRIRERAYQIYVERGSRPGSPLEDWLSAERELVAKPTLHLAREGRIIVAELDLTGVAPDQIQVKADGAFLLVYAPGKEEGQDSQPHPAPSVFGAFELFRQIDKNTIRAEYEQGTLWIVGSSEADHGALQMTA